MRPATKTLPTIDGNAPTIDGHAPVIDGHAPAAALRVPGLRVASVPSSHPLGMALAADDRDTVQRPVPELSHPAWLRPDDPAVQVDRADLVHLHGGIEACDPDELATLLRVLHERGVAVVASLGELRASDEVDRTLHDARLRALLQGADACTTITHAAAAEVRERFGIEPVVVPWLGVVSDARVAACVPRPAAPPVVGLGVTRLSADTALEPAVEALATLLGQDPQVRVQVHVHERLGDRADAVLAPLLQHDRVAIRFAGWMVDDRLFDWVEQLDVLLLPHRWSTHSSWIGLAHNLGTVPVGVATPSMRELGLSAGYVVEDDEPSPGAIRDALGVGLALATLRHPTPHSRQEQLRTVRDAHATLYGLVTGRCPV